MLPKEKTEFISHVRRLRSLSGSNKQDFGSRVVFAVLHQILKQRYPSLPRAGILADKALLQRPAITNFQEWLVRLPFLDMAFWLSSAYASLIPDKLKKNRALFFTPPVLSKRLIANLTTNGANLSTGKIIDPACGGSAFLAPVAGEIVKTLERKGWSSGRIVRHIERHLWGFDIDPVLCRLSKAFLGMALYRHIKASERQPRFLIRTGDALIRGRSLLGEFDIVISNPPYRKLGTREIQHIPTLYTKTVHGQPNIYGLFIDFALQLAKPGALVGLLTPTGFFAGKNFTKLRSLILDNAIVEQVDFVEPRVGVFLDVQQETALSVLRKKNKSTSSKRSASVYVINGGMEFLALGKVKLPSDGGRPWVLPRSKQEQPLTRLFTGPLFRLADYGYTPRTGYLVPHRHKRVKKLRLCEHDKKGKNGTVFPLIWATQVGRDGKINFTAGKGERSFIYVDVKRASHAGVHMSPGVVLQRTSSKDQNRRLVCAPIKQAFVRRYKGYMGENHVCFLVPVKDVTPSVSVETLSTIMNSHLLDKLFRCLSGTATVSAYELKALPLPDPQIVQQELNKGRGIVVAVAKGFGLKQ